MSTHVYLCQSRYMTRLSGRDTGRGGLWPSQGLRDANATDARGPAEFFCASAANSVLKRNVRAYSKFVRRMHGVGECELGVFFVHKKRGGKIRLILDCRRANARFRAPPGTELLGSECFSNIEFDGIGCEKTALEQLRLYLWGDVADCFHRMRLKGSIRRFFCWPSLSAASLGILEVEGQRVDPERRVWPMANSLPMGWSWSLYFAQKANLRRISSVGLLS